MVRLFKRRGLLCVPFFEGTAFCWIVLYTWSGMLLLVLCAVHRQIGKPRIDFGLCGLSLRYVCLCKV